MGKQLNTVWLVLALAACASDTAAPAPTPPPAPPPPSLTGTWQYVGRASSPVVGDCTTGATVNIVQQGNAVHGGYNDGLVFCGTEDDIRIFEAGLTGTLEGGALDRPAVAFSFADWLPGEDWPNAGELVTADSMDGTFSGEAVWGAITVTIDGTWYAVRDDG